LISEQQLPSLRRVRKLKPKPKPKLVKWNQMTFPHSGLEFNRLDREFITGA